MKAKFLIPSIALLLVGLVLGFGFYQYKTKPEKRSNWVTTTSATPQKNSDANSQLLEPTIVWSSGSLGNANANSDITAELILLIDKKSISLGFVRGLCIPPSALNDGALAPDQISGTVCFPKGDPHGVAFGLFKTATGYVIKKASVTRGDTNTATFSEYTLVKEVN